MRISQCLYIKSRALGASCVLEYDCGAKTVAISLKMASTVQGSGAWGFIGLGIKGLGA